MQSAKNSQEYPFSVSTPENLRLKNNLQFLACRELGLKKEMNTFEMLAMKASQLHVTNQLTYWWQEYPETSIDFVRSNESYIIAACHEQYNAGIMYLMEVVFRPKSSSEDSPPLVTKLKLTEPLCTLYPVVDCCFSKMQSSQQELFAYVTRSDPHINNNTSNVVFYIMGDNAVQLLYAISSKLFSCAFSASKERFVAGAWKKLYFYESLHFVRTIDVPVIPIALEFDETGNLIYMGDATSGLCRQDLRTPLTSSSSSIIFPGRVSELKLMSDQNTIILREGDNLVKVDLRTERAVLNYEGSELRDLKAPFSVSEKSDILCSTGLDNVTRLWSLNSSQPLCTIRPNISSYVNSCILSNDDQWGVAIFERDTVNIFEP